MSDILILRARLRKRDKDIQQAVARLKLEEGEMADRVRDGFRKELMQRDAMGTIASDAAKLVAKELMQGIRERQGS